MYCANKLPYVNVRHGLHGVQSAFVAIHKYCTVTNLLGYNMAHGEDRRLLKHTATQ